MVDEFEFFLAKAWSDGLPVVTPTEARVQRMLTGTRRAPEEFLGLIPPALEPASMLNRGCRESACAVAGRCVATMLNPIRE